MRTRPILLMLAATIAACGHSMIAKTGSGGNVVPWSSQTPGPAVTKYATATGDVPDCTASALSVSVFAEGAAGSLAGGIDAKNVSSSGCRLSGRPVVAILDKKGKTIPAEIEAAKPEFEAEQTPPGWPSVFLRRGDTATATVFMSEWCTPRLPATWRVKIPSIDSVFTPAETATPPCRGGSQPADNPDSRPIVSVGPFQPHPIEGPEVAYPFEATIRAPKSVAANTPIRYTVTLKNTSAFSFTFADCPAYQESLSGRGTKAAGTYVLNCSEIGAIPPGRSVVFAIELRQWIVAHAGMATRFWSMANGVSDVAHIVVTGA